MVLLPHKAYLPKRHEEPKFDLAKSSESPPSKTIIYAIDTTFIVHLGGLDSKKRI